jgi:hypothetical protein
MDNTEERNWGAEPWRAPTLDEGDTLIYSECGRVLDNTCYRSHWFMLVREHFGGYAIVVKHGAGQERVPHIWSKRIVSALEHVDSDSRYFLMHTIYRAYKDGHNHGATAVANEYREAFVSGRLRKRKLPAQRTVKVWIERKPIITNTHTETP